MQDGFKTKICLSIDTVITTPEEDAPDSDLVDNVDEAMESHVDHFEDVSTLINHTDIIEDRDKKNVADPGWLRHEDANTKTFPADQKVCNPVLSSFISSA
jgi:hypothetical protein